ncbi:hypothetical protein BDZ88DRAFT_489970 [Geranomyces variabilis]|nr:hypothetical protein BDZ88DRAFT_489970 [Geranomyces variabilis]
MAGNATDAWLDLPLPAYNDFLSVTAGTTVSPHGIRPRSVRHWPQFLTEAAAYRFSHTLPQNALPPAIALQRSHRPFAARDEPSLHRGLLKNIETTLEAFMAADPAKTYYVDLDMPDSRGGRPVRDLRNSLGPNAQPRHFRYGSQEAVCAASFATRNRTTAYKIQHGRRDIRPRQNKRRHRCRVGHFSNKWLLERSLFAIWSPDYLRFHVVFKARGRRFVHLRPNSLSNCRTSIMLCDARHCSHPNAKLGKQWHGWSVATGPSYQAPHGVSSGETSGVSTEHSSYSQCTKVGDPLTAAAQCTRPVKMLGGSPTFVHWLYNPSSGDSETSATDGNNNGSGSGTLSDALHAESVIAPAADTIRIVDPSLHPITSRYTSQNP